MKTKFYTVEDLIRMGKEKELGFSDETISRVMVGQLTIFNTSDIKDNQMSIYDMLPKKANKRKIKRINIK